MNLKKHWPVAAIVIITLMALWLRLYRLDWQCPMVDEILTQSVAVRPAIDTILWALSVDYNPPTYYLLAHYSSLLFGDNSMFAVRFPAVIFGTLSIPIIYLIGKDIKSPTLGLLAASCATVMFPFFYYSQNARAYSLVMFAFLCFVWFWLRLYNGKTEMRYIVGAGFFAALCLWSHYFALVPLTVLMLALFWESFSLGIDTTIVSAVFLSPMVFLFDLHQFVSRTHREIFTVYWLTPYTIAVTVINEMFGWSWLVIVPLALYSVLRAKDPVLRVFVIAGTITPLLLIVVAYFTVTMPRYALITAPLVLLAALYPIAEYIDREPDIKRKIAIALLLVFSVAVLNYGSFVSWTTFSVCPYVHATPGSAFITS